MQLQRKIDEQVNILSFRLKWIAFLDENKLVFCFVYCVLIEQGPQADQREARQSGEFLRRGGRADAQRAEPAARGGGRRPEQNQSGVVLAGGAGETEEGAERHTAGEEDHRGLGANIQERNGKSKSGYTFSYSLFLLFLVL